MYVLALFCFSLGGCGGEQLPDGMPKPYPTEITVLQGGSPLEGATVALMSADPSNPWSASATTDATGKANIKIQGRYVGAVPGKYHVLVTKSETDESKFVIPDATADPAGYAKYMNEGSGEVLNTYDLIDPKFNQLTANTETIEVVAGKNEKTIDVGAAVRIMRVFAKP